MGEHFFGLRKCTPWTRKRSFLFVLPRAAIRGRHGRRPKMYAESHFDLCFLVGEGFQAARGTRGTGIERVYGVLLRKLLSRGGNLRM